MFQFVILNVKGIHTVSWVTSGLWIPPFGVSIFLGFQLATTQHINGKMAWPFPSEAVSKACHI